ncbi:MAG: S1 family peptidase [Dongiaceae bacterium]
MKHRTAMAGLAAVAIIAVGVALMSIAPLGSVASSPDRPSSGDVIARSLGSAVQLFAEREGGAQRTGSGVALAIGGDGRTFILTAGHVLAPQVAQTVYVSRPGSDARAEATILALDAEADIAILETGPLDVTPVRLQTAARLGDAVWVVSFPWGGRGTLVGGAVSQVGAAGDKSFPLDGPVGLIDAAVSYGTSGGGVFDARSGQLVGIVRGYRTAKLALPGTPVQNLEFPIAGETTVVPVSAILCLLARAQLAGATGIDAPGAAAGCAQI